MMVKVPQLEIAEEIGLLIGELRVGNVGELLLVDGALARVL
jgi:hypothetical protein